MRTPDRQDGLSSIATVFGARVTTRIVLIFYITSSALLVSQGLPASIIGLTGLIYAINVWPYRNINDKKSGDANKAWRRFIWLNLFTGFVLTMVLLIT